MLKRKMLRDIKLNLSQFITIFLMVLLGVGIYSGIRSYMDGMTNSGNKYYEENNLQDLVLNGNLSEQSIEEIKKLDNINDTEGKLTVLGTSNDNTIEINFIESNKISKFYLKDGINFNYDKDGVWIDVYYAKENNIKVGDTINITYGTLNLSKKVLGIIYVPDHVYSIKDENEIFPSHKDFGFIYMSFKYSPVKTYSSIMVDIKDIDKIHDTKDSLSKIDNVIAITERENSISYAMYKGEIEEGETYVGVFSGLFLFIALLSVITTMNRVVKKQRLQIGTLKALGYSDFKIVFHYVSYGLIISLVAALIGLFVGPLTLGNVFMSMEMNIFEVPNYSVEINTMSYLVTIIVVLLICLVSYLSCKNELKDNPAETLRVKLPKVKVNNLNMTNKKLFRNLSFSTKWNIRDIVRNKLRTFMGVAGITGCCMLLVCAFGIYDTMDDYIVWQFDDLSNFEYKLTLREDVTNNELNDIISKYGDSSSMNIGIELDLEDKKENSSILVSDADELLRYTDVNRNFITLDNGIYITEKMASNLDLKIGDTIKWHIFGSSKMYETKIIAFNRNPQSQTITITKEYLESLGIDYKMDTIYTNNDLSKVDSIKGVDVISSVSSLKEGMNNMLNTMRTLVILIILAAAVLGSVIIYNLGILSYTEKQYQFATLKVLGFSDKKIRNIFKKQNIWLTIISTILGSPLGYIMTNFIFTAALNDEVDLSAHISINSYIIGIVGTIIVSMVVNQILSRKVNKIDMVTSLKGNE